LAVVLASWATLAPLSGAVVADGVVVADGQRKTVQHQEGGIVQTIHVKDGDQVHAGQALITLDAVRVDAELEAGHIELDGAMARQARLGAERALGSVVNYPAQLTGQRSERRVAELLQRESALFAARRHALDEQIGLTRQQIADTRQEIAALAASVTTTQDAHDIARTEYKTNENLKAQGFISDVRLLELRRNQADYLARSQTQQTELAKAQGKKTELELRVAAFRSDYVKQAETELKDAEAQVFKLQAQILPLLDTVHRQTLTAPVAGEVVDLKVHTLGAPIGPREPLLDIAPAQAHLMVEARVKPENIEDIHPGSLVDVRLTAYKQRNTPVLEGSLRYLGADRLVDKTTNQPYYLAHIEISPSEMERARKTAGMPIALSAGMGAEVFVKTRNRTALDYWLEPIANGARRSMRER
jgi:epimerase transport system membrane fusion protein